MLAVSNAQISRDTTTMRLFWFSLFAVLLAAGPAAAELSQPDASLPLTRDDIASNCAAIFLIVADQAAGSNPARAQQLNAQASLAESNYSAGPLVAQAAAVQAAANLRQSMATGRMSAQTLYGAYQNCSNAFPPQ